MSAAQIDRILEQKPEVMIELKSMVADQLTQQGVNTQADSISDEMLYHLIATNADLRANITLWLRSRGFVTEEDIRRSTTEIDSRSEDNESQSTSASPFDRLRDASDAGLALDGSSSLIPPSSDAASGALAGNTPQPGGAQNGSPNTPSNRRQRNITDEPDVLRVPTPYNLRSLRDLYTQIPQEGAPLRRFGSDVFLNRNGGLSAGGGSGSHTMSIDLPVGPDYVLGSGDGLTINLSGGVSQNLTRVIDREGKVALPEAGTLVVAGLTLQHAQGVIESALKGQYRNVRVDVTVARFRTVRVYVVGDVQRPGGYDLSSLSTPLNGLYAAGGPTSVGSLRIVRHYRGKELIREIDLYDFLLHGVRLDDDRLQSGDTLLIPPAGPQVAVSGMVKRPAIYELKGESSLTEVLDDAGGTTVAAALQHITVERIQPNQQRESVSVELPAAATAQSTLAAIAAFKVKDGDRVHVAPILPYSDRVVYVEGHVVRPGRYPYREGMQVSDILHSYQDLLPEPAARGNIVRLVPPDLHPETIPFDVPDMLIGNGNLALQPFDTIRILGRYETDSPQVSIRGEVLKPGKYSLSQGMTASQLVKMAGGFKRDALVESADLTSYTIQDKKKVVSERASINIADAMKGRLDSDVQLKAGDVLTIHQISGWKDIGASVVLDGEVTYPGSYGLQEGERLSSVLRRAGGFRTTAYPAGAVLVRVQVRELEEKSRSELINQIETASASARLSPNLTGQSQSGTLQAVSQQRNEVLQRLKSQPASGRLVIRVSADIESWENTAADIEMRSGDVLTVPKRPGFVLVSGQVYNPSAITYVPGKDAAWYLRRAGGTNDIANRKEIFIVRANGLVVGRRSGEWYGGGVLSTKLDPGDVIVIPQKIIGDSLFWRNLLTVAQITSSIAITAAVAGII
ncbi:SLBB domain-containing protein [Granulicella sp. dw_53]|uniref:SLBB domain-containing protein n=1 Tax=Granulicella sp. dw_53 TaxID=2719792 RepID=UPI002101FBF8|nr:SLBB domain-containing protein [Granulicella sp. dw_53]